ncbi:MAG: hypothetical protein AAF702_46640 [Chloroflexota bacterium]
MRKTSIGHYALAYLFWLVTLAITLLACSVLVETVVGVLGLAEFHRFFIRAVRQFLIFFLGILVLGLLVYNEHYFRTGAERHRLLERFARMTGIWLLIMGISHLIGIFIILRSVSPGVLLVGGAVVELFLGIGALWYARRSTHAHRQRARAYT